MRKLNIAFALSIASSAYAEDMQMRLADAGFAAHSTHGRGFELIIEIRGAAVRDVPDRVFGEICAQVGPQIIPQLRTHEDSFEPNYIGIRLTGGGFISTQKFVAFAPNGDSCGPEL